MVDEETPAREVLDLTGLEPRQVDVIVGGKTYTVSTDLTPVMYARIIRTMKDSAAELQGGEKADVEYFFEVYGQILGISKARAKKLGFQSGMQLMSFLAKPLSGLM